MKNLIIKRKILKSIKIKIMKNLGKLKLNKISKKEMVHLKGGYSPDPSGVCVTPSCSCGCLYYGEGGSSTSDNCSANHRG